MAKDAISTGTDHCIMEIGRTDASMDLAMKRGKMAQSTRDSMIGVGSTVSASTSGMMEPYTLANGNTI